MKQLEVTILGHSYLLACPEGGETLLRAAVTLVDQEMSAIRDAKKVKARERMAVLAALNLAYRLVEPPSPQPAALNADMGTEANIDAEAVVAELIARLDSSLAGDGQLL